MTHRVILTLTPLLTKQILSGDASYLACVYPRMPAQAPATLALYDLLAATLPSSTGNLLPFLETLAKNWKQYQPDNVDEILGFFELCTKRWLTSSSVRRRRCGHSRVRARGQDAGALLRTTIRAFGGAA